MTPVSHIGVDLSLPVPGTEEVIRATCYRIETSGGPTFDLYIAADADDGISVAIREGNFPLSSHTDSSLWKQLASLVPTRSRTVAHSPAFDLLPALVPSGGRVLDLGAHIGTFGLFAAALGYEVVCVEASARNAVLLRASIEKNGFAGRVRVVEAAVSNREGTLEFMQAGPYGLVANASIDLPKTPVRAATITQVLAEVGWERVDFIKMDIEGSEVKGVQGMIPLLAADDAPPLLYESNGVTLRYFGQTPYTLVGSLEALGYRCYRLHGNQLVPTDSMTLQPDAVIDVLAAKSLPATLDGWEVRDTGLTRKEMVRLVVDGLTHWVEDHRAWTARALEQGDAALLSEEAVQQALQRATADTHPKVREAVAWFLADSARAKPRGPIGRLIDRAQRWMT